MADLENGNFMALSGLCFYSTGNTITIHERALLQRRFSTAGRSEKLPSDFALWLKYTCQQNNYGFIIKTFLPLYQRSTWNKIISEFYEFDRALWIPVMLTDPSSVNDNTIFVGAASPGATHFFLVRWSFPGWPTNLMPSGTDTFKWTCEWRGEEETNQRKAISSDSL